MYRKFKGKNKVIIGLLGCGRGVGTTHLSIMTAGYVSSVLHAKTAILDFAGRSDFYRVGALYFSERELCEGSFSLKKVDFFMNPSKEKMLSVCNAGYEYVLLDLGCDFPTVREELLRCDEKWIVGSLSDWKKETYVSFLKQMQMEPFKGSGCRYFTNFLPIDEKELCRQFQISFYAIPYVANPFHIKKEHFSFFQKIV